MWLFTTETSHSHGKSRRPQYLQFKLPAFIISSVYGTEKLIRNILASTLIDLGWPCFFEADGAWKLACPHTKLPVKLFSQTRWDDPLCRVIQNNLLDTCATSAERARLLVVTKWESGLWPRHFSTIRSYTVFSSSLSMW